ncbi:MAG TPA: Ig-like domain-containing protein [Chitinophagaceae bacterium]|nr:Ig-like domain-containing protein [Chitinophagaceae bacterium]
MKRIFICSLFILFAIQKIVVLSGCANIVPPAGGPRDSIPPLLLKAEPGDSSLNFKGNKVTFTFDEFVDVQNVSENLLASPLPVNPPLVDFKLKTVTLKLKDSLEPNTTYTFNFGNAIRDFTEGNPIKDFSYTFSTGAYLDSLQLSGKVVLAETGKIDTTLIVMLHTNSDDSAVVKEKPRYIARLDSKGSFSFNNLPAKKFYLYALKDEGGSRRYFGEKQLFAFADKPVELKAKNDSMVLYAYASKNLPPPPTIPAAGNITIGRKTTGGTADKRLKFTNNLVNGQQDLLSEFYLSFDTPLRSFDSNKIKLFTDSSFTPDKGYRFEKDSTNRKIVLTQEWKENTLYHIILQKDFAEDSTGKKLLKDDTLSFKTKKLSEYGSLKMKFKNLDMSKNPVLIFILGSEANQKSFPLSGPDFSQTLFLPGEYDIRILYDTNKNGSWDPGQFFGKHLQPEIAKPIERKINIKPGWQNEFDIAL